MRCGLNRFILLDSNGFSGPLSNSCSLGLARRQPAVAHDHFLLKRVRMGRARDTSVRAIEAEQAKVCGQLLWSVGCSVFSAGETVVAPGLAYLIGRWDSCETPNSHWNSPCSLHFWGYGFLFGGKCVLPGLRAVINSLSDGILLTLM